MSNTTASTIRRALTHLPYRALALAIAASMLGACAPAQPEDRSGDVTDAEGISRFSGIPQEANVLGSPSAPVTLVEFSDLRCSHCRDFDDRSLPVILDRYVRTGKVRFVFQNYPILGPASVDAARLAAAAGLQGRQFELIDAMFHRTPGPLSDEVMRRVASQVPGLDVEKAMAQRTSPEVEAALVDARTMGDRYAIEGTPTFLIGRTGGDLHAISSARANRPETLTGPIDALLAQP